MGKLFRRRSVAEPLPWQGDVFRVPEPPPWQGEVFRAPERFNFTRDVVEALAATDPLRPALTFVNAEGIIDRSSFAKIAADASRWAALLRARGLVPGDRLLVHVGKTPAWHAVLLGALKAGLVTVPCPETLRPRELVFRGEHSEAQLVVADRERAPVFAEMDVPVDVVVVEEVSAELRDLSAVQPTHDTASDDIAFILYTSGTSGDPKGAVHTHEYTWANRLQAQHWLDVRRDDLVWCTAGTGWAKSIWNVLLGPWSCGAEIVIHEGGFDAEQRLELLQQLGVTVLCQTPTEYRLMAKLPSLARFDLRRLRHAVSAGEPLNAEVITAFRDAFGLTVYDGYGQAENTVLVANRRDMEIKPGSMGLPTPGHKVFVIDDEGNEQPVGVEGDIALRGEPPSLFLGYWDAPDDTNAVFRGPWYVTGDRATRDEDGYLWFTGRSDDVIISAAFRIGPLEVETALLEHPAVAESAVIGKPDADRGQIVKAFVVLRAAVEPSDGLATELQDHVKAVTAPYMVPREIEFVSELPKTSSGKMRRIELRERERSAADFDRVAAAEALAAELATEEARAEEQQRQADAARRVTEQHRAQEERRAAEARAAAEAANAAEAKAQARRDAAKRRRAERAAEKKQHAAQGNQKPPSKKAQRLSAKGKKHHGTEQDTVAEEAPTNPRPT